MKEPELYFIYVGNAYPHKNLKRLIAAFLSLNKKVKEEIKLYLVSSRNVFTDRLKRDVENLGAEDLILLPGFVSDRKLKIMYQKSIASVFPSLSEGFGLPALEAMRAQSLVLASDIPVFREIYRDVPIYFNPLDVNAIFEALKLALEMDPIAKERRIGKGLELVKKYSWTKMARETLNVYQSCALLRSSQ